MNRDNELIKQWVEDLRSGQFQQTTQTLFDGTGYCCLGVLCKRAVKNGIMKEGARFGNHVFIIGGDDYVVELSTELDGFKDTVGITEEEEIHLIRMNDGYSNDNDQEIVRKHNFTEIADYIEQNILE